MATITQSAATVNEGERRFLLPDVGWQGYEALLKMIGDRPIRVSYDRGIVELMSPLNIHEHYRTRSAHLVNILSDELDIDIRAAGSTTFNRWDLEKGLEPDECFYLTNIELVAGKRHIDLNVDPPPDLAIEIEITRSVLGRLGIHASLKIPEVWQFDGETLTVLLLGPDEVFTPGATSAAFPFLPMEKIARFLKDEEASDTRWGRRFRAWVREVVAPLARRPGGAE